MDLKEKVRVLFRPQETKKDIRPRKGPPYHKDKYPFSLVLIELGATKNKVNFCERKRSQVKKQDINQMLIPYSYKK